MTAHWEDPDLILEFVVEAGERLDATDSDLLRLEKSSADSRALDSALGNLHNIKGSAGFVGLPTLQAACHGTETLLGGLRRCPPDASKRVDLAFDGVTAMRSYLDALETAARSNSPIRANSTLRAYLRKLSARGIVIDS